MRAVHAIVSGRVQGVGYRAWVEREAATRGLAGWVRNRRDGSVEAVFAGPAEAVEAMLAACWAGPPAARVEDIASSETSAAPPAGFTVLPTA
jgi:acylphosphatase